jgi:hypothetical protein
VLSSNAVAAMPIRVRARRLRRTSVIMTGDAAL